MRKGNEFYREDQTPRVGAIKAWSRNTFQFPVDKECRPHDGNIVLGRGNLCQLELRS